MLNKKIVSLAVAATFATASTLALAVVPPEVASSITAAQTDILETIGKGFVYIGATAGLMTVLMVFKGIIKRGK